LHCYAISRRISGSNAIETIVALMPALLQRDYSPLEYLDISVSEFVAVVRLIDDLGDSDDVALVIADRHRQDQRCLITGPHINGAVESWILKA